MRFPSSLALQAFFRKPWSFRPWGALGRLRISVPRGLNLSLDWRVRATMYAVLLLVGGEHAWQTWKIEKSEAVRLADAEVIRVAAAQSTLTQRMGMLASLLVVAEGTQEERGNALADALEQAQNQAPHLEELLKQQGAWQEDANSELRRAIFNWQDSRERLWYRAQSLLGHADRKNLPQLMEAIRSFQSEVDPAMLVTQQLVEQVQRAAQKRAREAVDQIEASAALMLLMLLGLTLVVVEPFVRFVRRQQEALVRQTTEVQRLALVAQRTSNWVAVLDVQRRMLWCNDAFLRAKGATLEQMVGQFPGLLVGNEHVGPQELARLRELLGRGEAVRAELMHRTAEGKEVWLDVDYQPIDDADGAHVGFTVVAIDITERVNQRLQMHTLLNALPAGVILQSASGEVIECNVAATELLGLSREALIGRRGLTGEGGAVRDDLTPYPVSERPSNRTLRLGKGLRGESMGLLSDSGEVRWLLVNTEPIRDAAGNLTGVVSCSVDVSAQKAQQQVLALAIEGASLGLWEWDIVTGEMSCNESLLQLYGYERGGLDMKVEAWNAIIHPADLEGWRWAVKANMRDSTHPLAWEIRIRHGSSDRWVWMMYSGTVVSRDSQGRAVRMAGICYDINGQKELEERLRYAARTDSLTQLPNRAELLSRIHTAIERVRQKPGSHFAVLFMDFDRFKQINDTLGHSVGDELLRQIALRLQESLRPSDAFIQTSDFQQMAARIGGDEFVVLLDEIRGDLDAQVVASRLLDVLSEPYLMGEHRVNSSVSIGIVTTEHMADDPESVLRDADIAMYEAKREGRGRYVMFDPSMRKRVRDDVSLENDLRMALEQDEIQVVYQPLVDLSSGLLAGTEALVRWNHPLRGRVSPVVFIPIAESNGLIGRLGKFVLQRACEDFVRLQSLLGDRAPPSVSVNLSRAQLRQANLVSDIQEVLDNTGVKSDQLILEVTESLAAQDDAIKTVLHQIRGLGVALSLDDFGTGYSSLSCLHELPVNVVKIDRSFVSQALTSDYHRVMIEATIRMASTLGLSTVAEGIETEEQADLMTTMGCGKGQGYLYSQPLTVEELVRWRDLRQVQA